MAGNIYIPDEVKAAIAKHISAAVDRSRQGYLSGSEDEDVLTGDLGACLRIGSQSVDVVGNELSGTWKWSMTYYKFGGRGKGATESLIGADGIFEVTLDDGRKPVTKSLLFQAKKEWQTDDHLFSQALLLSTWREAAVVINYNPDEFEAFSLDNVIGSHGRRSVASSGVPLAKLLGETFLDCKIGDTSLSYDARFRKLYWQDAKHDLVCVDFGLKHRIGIKLKPPGFKPHIKQGLVITPDKIHEHRMKASEQEILSVSHEATAKEVKTAHKLMAMAYHSDRLGSLDEILRNIANRRMQEINQAKDECLARAKARHNH